MQGENNPMRTKNKKWIGPVPIALVAVFALAAFISAGLLLAPNGATPAEAQSVDCTINVGGTGDTTVPTIPDTIQTGSPAVSGCTISGDTVVIALPGRDGTAAAATQRVWVYAQDGTIVGGTALNDVFDHDQTGNASPNTPTAPTFSAFTSEIAKATPAGLSGGSATRSTVNITVNKKAGQSVATLYIYYQGDAPIPAADFDHDSDGNCDPNGTATQKANCKKQINNPGATANGTVDDNAGTLTVTFLGPPALGADEACDNNTTLDDTINSGTDPATGVTLANCLESDRFADDNNDDSDNVDHPETRSQLILSGGATTVAISDGGKSQLNGETRYELTTQTSVTLTAVIKDADTRALLNETVSFEVVSQTPEGLIGSRTTTPRTKTATDPQQGIEGVEAGEAVAQRVITGLPTNSSYQVKIKATAGDITLGTAVIARPGDLHEVNAYSCVADTDNKKNEMGCPSGEAPATVYAPGASIIINAKALDALGTDTSSTTITVEEADADAKVFDGTSPHSTTGGKATIVVNSKAPAGEYTLTVKARQAASGSARPDAIERTDTVTIRVSGKLSGYALMGPASGRVGAGKTETFTIQAQDASGNQVVSSGDKPDVVLTGPGASSVTLLDLTGGALTDELDNDGKGTFRLFVSSSASSSYVTVTVIGKSGTDATEMHVRIGANQNPTAGAAIDTQTIMMGGEATVTTTIADPDAAPGDTLSHEWTSSDDAVATVAEDATNDGMATITAVAVGTAIITVTATDSDGGEGTQTINVAVNSAPMAGDDLMDQKMTVGDTMMVTSTITDSGDATLGYSWQSDDPAVATVAEDATDDMKATVTAVGAGSANIKVTATDSAGETDSQSFKVMVNAVPTKVGSIEAMTLTAGDTSTMDVSDYFSDPGDTLTYTAESDKKMYATASVDDSDVTITAVAAGMATITVTATDGSDATATQTVEVTVEAASLMAPTDVKVNAILGTVTVEWTAGRSAEGHVVVLFDADATFVNSAFLPDPATTFTSFGGVASGDYYVIVAAYMDNDAGEREYAYDFLGTDVTVQ